MSATPRLLAVCAGKATTLLARERDGRMQRIVSGIGKQPLSTLEHPVAVRVAELGVDGDEIVDLSVHGGLDKAVYVYPAEHYAFWRTVREQAGVREASPPGLLGENLLLEGLLEGELRIGDQLAIGEVLLRIESPRSPCHKFNLRMGFSWASSMMIQSGYTGAYCSVIRAGHLSAGLPVAHRRGGGGLGILESHRLRHGNHQRSLF
jgi:MOSC domain-containing protein YiiM